MTHNEFNNLEKDSVVYYTRIIEKCDIFEVLPLTVVRIYLKDDSDVDYMSAVHHKTGRTILLDDTNRCLLYFNESEAKIVVRDAELEWYETHSRGTKEELD